MNQRVHLITWFIFGEDKQETEQLTTSSSTGRELKGNEVAYLITNNNKLNVRSA